MGSNWKKVKSALGSNLCLYIPPTLHDSPSSSSNNDNNNNTNRISGARFSDVGSPSDLISLPGHGSVRRPTTPTPSSSDLRVAKPGTRSSSKKICAICLTTMKAGQGHAIFTAECSHSFHFHCITSNVMHGNQICPVCRAKWKEIPFQTPTSDLSHISPEIPFQSPTSYLSHIRPEIPAQNENWATHFRTLPSPHNLLLSRPEPALFDDDELVTDPQDDTTQRNTSIDNNSNATVEVNTYPEISSVPKSVSHNNFNILIHIKAPLRSERQDQTTPSGNSRAPVDFVTVLDVSGSMAGTKLALLKRAMGFVIQNLGPSDRLSVISFSSTARRLFNLRRMTVMGRQEALQAVNTLVSNGGTNIAEGLRKGAKVLTDRTSKNPVSSIILLSDGQDTYTVNSPNGSLPRTNYHSLLPASVYNNNGTRLQIPVHSFGFGKDHDAASMHAISELSGGTFSFIEAENVIQDAFAQCIGGLLSVVVQKLQVGLECVHPGLRLGLIRAGSYQSTVNGNSRTGSIYVGDLYAEEERDFVVTVDILPDESHCGEMLLMKVTCTYRDPITKEMLNLPKPSEVKIDRPVSIGGEVLMSLEVDRQMNRLRAAEVMAEARGLAERGELTEAVSVLESCRKVLSDTASARAGDRLCASLCAELKEIQERMVNRRAYEASGRAYVLSGLSSHSWQRATARGDSTDSGSIVQSYQTPSMVDMVSRSQTMVFGNPLPQRTFRAARSFKTEHNHRSR